MTPRRAHFVAHLYQLARRRADRLSWYDPADPGRPRTLAALVTLTRTIAANQRRMAPAEAGAARLVAACVRAVAGRPLTATDLEGLRILIGRAFGPRPLSASELADAQTSAALLTNRDWARQVDPHLQVPPRRIGCEDNFPPRREAALSATL